LLDEFGARDEHGEHADANFSADNSRDAYAVQDQAYKPDDGPKRCFIDVGEEGRHHSGAEEFDFIAHGGRKRRAGDEGGEGVPNDVEAIEVDGEESEKSQALLIVEVAKDARNSFLAFGWAQELNEWVRCGGTIGQ
jgi:hypothetical protein